MSKIAYLIDRGTIAIVLMAFMLLVGWFYVSVFDAMEKSARENACYCKQ